jgi:uncharacterized membrane protein
MKIKGMTFHIGKVKPMLNGWLQLFISTALLIILISITLREWIRQFSACENMIPDGKYF